MKKHAPTLVISLVWLLATCFTLMQAGVIPAIIPAAVPTANKTASGTQRFFICDASENCVAKGDLESGLGGAAIGALLLKDPTGGGLETITWPGGAGSPTITMPVTTGTVPYISGVLVANDCLEAGSDALSVKDSGIGPCGSGGGGGTGGGIGNITAVTANANVTSDQTLQELSLTAGFYNSAAQVSAIYGSGIYTIAGGITPTLTWKVKLCTVSGCGSGTVVTLATFTTTATTAASTNYPWNINLGSVGTHATGATGNLIVHGFLSIDLGASALTAETVFNDANTAVSSNIDLTAALFVDVTVAASSGSASNSFTEQYLCTFLPGSNAASASVTQPYLSIGAAQYGPVWTLTTPPLTGWTGDNLNGSTTFDTTSGYPFLNAQPQSILQAEFRTAPSTPYTLTAYLASAMFAPASNNNFVGFGFRDGTGKIEQAMVGVNSGGSVALQVCKYTNSTTFVSCPFQNAQAAAYDGLQNGLLFIQIKDDGTNITFYYSIDGGNHLFQAFQEARTTFFGSGPTQSEFSLQLVAGSGTTHLGLLGLVQH